ncbi:MAG: hypothetical protein HQL22_07505 [Candidatus Omnitrophica bacterium]|nr:hypothetical protein [Candidatus Omnitrophota bacterium]
MRLSTKVSVILTGVVVVFGVTGMHLSVFAKDVVLMQSPQEITVSQRLDWERDAIRQGFKFDVAGMRKIKALPVIVRGYFQGPRQCQQSVREKAGPAPASWTHRHYQEIIDCKILFEGAAGDQLATDLSYFRLARTVGDKTHCRAIKDTDIRAFCQGPFPTPLPEKP